MSPETTFFVACVAMNAILTAGIGYAFRRMHINIGREELAQELFEQYREDQLGLESWLCKGAIVQLREKSEYHDTSEMQALRNRLLASRLK